MATPETGGTVEGKVARSLHGAHAKTQQRNKKGQFCRLKGVVDGEGLAFGAQAKRVRMPTSVGDRAKGGNVGASDDKDMSASDDKDMFRHLPTNPSSSRQPLKLSGIRYPVSEPERRKLKEVFVTKKVISEMIHVESSSSDCYYYDSEQSLFELDECFGPQLSSSEDKNTSSESSKVAKDTCTDKKKMKQTIEVGENSTFHLPSIGERLAQRKRKVQPKNLTKVVPQKKAMVQKKKVKTSSEVETLKSRVDGHDSDIEEINLQLAVLTEMVKPKKISKVPKKAAKMTCAETSSELDKLKSRVDGHDQAIHEINLQLGVLFDKVDASEHGSGQDYYSSDSD